jgi:hypothetical protein
VPAYYDVARRRLQYVALAWEGWVGRGRLFEGARPLKDLQSVRASRPRVLPRSRRFGI